MTELSRQRLIVSLVILTLLPLSGVHFGSQPPSPELGSLPSQDQLYTDYETYIGQKTAVAGPIRTLDPLTIEAETTTENHLTLEITGVSSDVDATAGDHLSVYGTVRPSGQITALETAHKPANAYWRTRGLSLLAGILVVGYGPIHWRFDITTLQFQKRESPLRLLTGGDKDG